MYTRPASVGLVRLVVVLGVVAALLSLLAVAPATASTSVAPKLTTGQYATFGLRSDRTILAAGAIGNGQTAATHWSDVSAMAAGAYHVVGLRTNGAVRAAGMNTEGQCAVGGWTGIKQVACGAFHTVGLKSDGSVVATGSEWMGSVAGAATWSDISTIAAGFDHTLGIKSDGSVVATGNTQDGACNVSSWSGIKAVTAGYHFTVGLKDDGTCIAVGRDTDSDNPGTVTNANDTAVWNNITAISASYGHVAGLKNDGTVVTSAGNALVPGWTDITQVAAGDNCIVGLRANGTLVTYQLPGYFDWDALDVGGWDLTPSKATLGKPAAPSSAKKSKYFTVKGTIKPIHAKGAKVVSVYFERRVRSHGKYVWKSRKTYLATDGTARGSTTPWSVKAKLTTKGYWRVRATHADAAHLASKSSYEYMWVK